DAKAVSCACAGWTCWTERRFSISSHTCRVFQRKSCVGDGSRRRKPGSRASLPDNAAELGESCSVAPQPAKDLPAIDRHVVGIDRGRTVRSEAIDLEVCQQRG